MIQYDLLLFTYSMNLSKKKLIFATGAVIALLPSRTQLKCRKKNPNDAGRKFETYEAARERVMAFLE